MNRLQEIERAIGQRPRGRPKAVAQAFDTGGPIELRFNKEFYAPARANALARRMLADLVPAPTAPRKRTEARPASARPSAAPHPEPAPTAAALATDVAEILSDEDARFARRIREGAQSMATSAAESAAPKAEETEEPRAEVAPVSYSTQSAVSPHALFDGLTFANAFDLGTVEVNFDAFDAALDREERTRAKQSRGGMAPPTRVMTESRGMAESEELDAISLVEDLASIAEAALETFSVKYDVPLVPQQTGMSCWAAGAAMIVGWRDKISIDPSEIAKGIGYWAPYQQGLSAEDTTMFAAWNLVPEAAQSYTIDGFRRLLEDYGPLWVASAEPGPHIRVATGIWGDGTPDNTYVEIADPWETGMAAFHLPNSGARYTETYRQFVAKQETLARRESGVQGIYVAHLTQKPPTT